MPGIEYMRGIIRGDFPRPPIASTLDFTLVEVDRGHAIFEGTPGRFVYNPIGSRPWWLRRDAARLGDGLRGAHHACPSARRTRPSTSRSATSARSPSTSGTLRAKPTVIHTGGSIVTAASVASSALDGTLYAHGTTTCLVLTPGAAARVADLQRAVCSRSA